MGDLPAGLAQKLQELEDEDDDDAVDYNIPTTWAASAFHSVSQADENASSASNDFASSTSTNRFAPAFNRPHTRQDPFEPQTQRFSFSTASPYVPQAPEWDTFDPDDETPRSKTVQDPPDLNASQNQALEGALGAVSATRGPTGQALDLDYEDPNLDIDDDVRRNFLPVHRLHEAPAPRSAIEMRNPTLIASKKSTPISTFIAGEEVIYTPKPVDDRVRHLDRHGNYIGEYRGEISKRLKRQHKEDVTERDRQMLQATSEYRVLAAMSAEQRTELLEQLRKPLIFSGAFKEDQFEEDEIPHVYNRSPTTARILNWMGRRSAHSADPNAQSSLAFSNATPVSHSGQSPSHGFDLLGTVGDVDGFVANDDFVPLELEELTLQDRNNFYREARQRYYRDAILYGRKQSAGRPQSSHSSAQSSNTPRGTQFGQPFFPSQSARQPNRHGRGHHSGRRGQPSSRSRTSQHSAQSNRSHLAKQLGQQTLGSISGGGQLTPSSARDTDYSGEVRSLYASLSSRGIDDPFGFDDTPEFQLPEDIQASLTTSPLTPENQKYFNLGTSISVKYGRVVLVSLHEPVKFTPGAIAKRVFGGIIQEMQLFPTQRLAIVVFLHPVQAKGFVRHVKNTREMGTRHEIRMLQIDAGWYK
jgi:hypothetical protein